MMTSEQPSVDGTAEIIHALREGRLHDAHDGSIDRAVTVAVTASYENLARLARPLHVYRPEALQAAPVRATFHLALEADRFEAHELFHVLQPYLADDLRFRELVDHSERLALGARIRLATLCQRIATAVHTFGAEAFVEGEREALYHGVLAKLVEDRDAEVGLRAAWAAGLWALSHRRWRQWLLESSDEAARPQRKRRGLAAATALWVQGEVPAAEFERDLESGLGKRDSFARATALLAMRFAARSAPATVIELAHRLVKASKTSEVTIAGAELAWSLQDTSARDELLAAVRSAASSQPPPALSVLLGPKSALAQDIVTAHRALVDAAAISPLAASIAAIALAEKLPEAPAADAECQEALERVLFDSTLFRDALLVGATDAGARRAAYETWVRAVGSCRASRVSALHDEARAERAEGWRRATRAVDASPRGTGRDGPPSQLGATALSDAKALRKAASRALVGTELEAAEVRPACVALVTAAEVESIVAGPALADAVATLLYAASDRALSHAELAASTPNLRAALSSLVRLADALGQASKPKGKKKPDVDVSAELRHASHWVQTLAEDPGAPLSRAFGALERAVNFTSAPKTSVSLVEAWKGACTDVLALRAAVFDHAGAKLPPTPSASRIDNALAGLFDATASQPRMLRDEAARRAVSVLLPPQLGTLLDALRPRDTPTPPAPRRKLGFGLKHGQVISDFVVERVLGGGAMGFCVEVTQRRASKKGAQERFVLKFPLGTDPANHQSFVDEARALITASRVPHPGVVQFYGYMTCAYKKPFLVMQYVPGPSLEQRIAKAPLGAVEALAIGARLADALAHCHASKIAHHDLKPGNVIVSEHGAVLVDFGIAGAESTDRGTPLYMAPERFDGAKGFDSHASDVFALACVLHEMWTRQPLLDGPIEPNEAAGVPKEVVALSKAISKPDAAPMGVWLVLGTIARNTSILARRLTAGLRHLPEPVRPALGALLHRMTAAAAQRPTAREVATELSRLSAAVR